MVALQETVTSAGGQRPNTVPVLVVGAGPTGLAVAIGLKSAGVQVRVIDAAQGPAETSRALGLQPRGVEVLNRLGALGDLVQRSVNLRGTVIRLNGQERLRLALPADNGSDGPPVLVISQAEIEAEMRLRFAALGGSIEWNCALAGITQDAEGATVTLQDGEAVRAGWVVGCDGASSDTRKAVGIHLVGETPADHFLLADVRLGLPVDRSFASMWAGGAGMLATIPLPGDDRWRLMAPKPHDLPDTLSDGGVVDVLSLLVRKLVNEAADIMDVTWTSSFRIHRRLAERYRRGRVLLAGDAAHINSPVGGQGMNTGLGDAENLAWKLALVAQGHAGETLLDSYEAERRPVAEAVVRTVGGIDKLLLAKNPVIAAMRDHVLFPVVNLPFVQRRIWRAASQLGITYRNGPLAQRPDNRGDGLQSGDRVPDLQCRRRDGTVTRLHPELRSTWAIVSANGVDASGVSELARARLGAGRVTDLVSAEVARDRVLLVRPDAHLGWHDGPRGERLADWLDVLQLKRDHLQSGKSAADVDD